MDSRHAQTLCGPATGVSMGTISETSPYRDASTVHSTCNSSHSGLSLQPNEHERSEYDALPLPANKRKAKELTSYTEHPYESSIAAECHQTPEADNNQESVWAIPPPPPMTLLRNINAPFEIYPVTMSQDFTMPAPTQNDANLQRTPFHWKDGFNGKLNVFEDRTSVSNTTGECVELSQFETNPKSQIEITNIPLPSDEPNKKEKCVPGHLRPHTKPGRSPEAELWRMNSHLANTRLTISRKALMATLSMTPIQTSGTNLPSPIDRDLESDRRRFASKCDNLAPEQLASIGPSEPSVSQRHTARRERSAVSERTQKAQSIFKWLRRNSTEPQLLADSTVAHRRSLYSAQPVKLLDMDPIVQLDARLAGLRRRTMAMGIPVSKDCEPRPVGNSSGANNVSVAEHQTSVDKVEVDKQQHYAQEQRKEEQRQMLNHVW
jgi:hypothetical protein